MSIPNPAGQLDGALAAPKYGTLIPNRVFVGGISGDTTEAELCRLFSSYGNVKSTKIIVDRAGVSKGYGFVTFETEHEAQKLQNDCDCIVLRDRKLNIAPAIKKQTICATNGAVYYAATPPTPAINNIPIEQFATVYPPGVPTMYPPTLPYQPFYQYYSVPMVPNAYPPQNVPTIWPQNYQGAMEMRPMAERCPALDYTTPSAHANVYEIAKVILHPGVVEGSERQTVKLGIQSGNMASNDDDDDDEDDVVRRPWRQMAR